MDVNDSPNTNPNGLVTWLCVNVAHYKSCSCHDGIRCAPSQGLSQPFVITNMGSK